MSERLVMSESLSFCRRRRFCVFFSFSDHSIKCSRYHNLKNLGNESFIGCNNECLIACLLTLDGLPRRSRDRRGVLLVLAQRAHLCIILFLFLLLLKLGAVWQLLGSARLDMTLSHLDEAVVLNSGQRPLLRLAAQLFFA